MPVALVLNGVPDLYLSMEEGLQTLQLLLNERQSRGCAVAPAGTGAFGVEYRIQHPTYGVETVYLTNFQEPADDLDDTG